MVGFCYEQKDDYLGEMERLPVPFCVLHKKKKVKYMKVLLMPSYNLVLVQNVIASQSYVESQEASLHASDVNLLIFAHSLRRWPLVSLSSLHSRT